MHFTGMYFTSMLLATKVRAAREGPDAEHISVCVRPKDTRSTRFLSLGHLKQSIWVCESVCSVARISDELDQPDEDADQDTLGYHNRRRRIFLEPVVSNA